MFTVNNLFVSFMGEQNIKGIGHPVIFIRFAGCNLRCSYCDTKEAQENIGKHYTLSELVERIKKMQEETGIKDICITGGEPLLQKNLVNLIESFNDGVTIFIETNGTIPIWDIKKYYPNVSFLLDFKTNSARVLLRRSVVLCNIGHLTENDYIKFLIGNELDYIEFEHFLKNCNFTAKVAIGVTWGSSIVSLVNRLKKDNLLGKIKINFQVHKLIIKPNYDSLIPKDV